MLSNKTQFQNSKKIAILLCTYNGEEFLGELLESIERQSYTNWEIWVSDDGSSDRTISILEVYERKWPEGRLSIHKGPKKGFVSNFLSAVCKVSVDADLYALADQDDIWDVDKLERAVNCLPTVPESLPALYCSRTRLINSKNEKIGLSPLFTKPPSFSNALMQNVGGGNTMLFNESTRTLLSEAGDDVNVATHDWWIYLVVTGCGGEVYYDHIPSLSYRQHTNNLIGMNDGWLPRIKRIQLYWQGCFRDWTDKNVSSLHRLHEKLTLENRERLERFSKSRETSLLPRILELQKSGLYRQTWWGNVGLYIAVIFKKL